MAYDLLLAPFGGDLPFMRRALVATLALALAYGPIGVFLILRRMTLVTDAMAHAILPGAAVGFLLSGLSLWTMSVGGLVAGLVVAVLAGAISRTTTLKEDASFAGFYLLALAGGVTLLAMGGSSVDLVHVLFGSILAVDDAALCLMAGAATLTLITMAAIYRPLLIECLDPKFMAAASGGGAVWHFAFLALLVVNTVAGFQALGTLMAVGLMVLPAVAARFWVRSIVPLWCLASVLAFASGYLGLLASDHLDAPSGPAIVLTAGILWIVSMLVGRHNSLRARLLRDRHFAG
ncbi:MAG: metal ABC transporter permease [Reyranellaceae bacterium]